MKTITTLSLCLFFCMNGYAQQEQYSREFGKVTQHEMTMKAYENDPDADAVMLYNQGEYRFTGDYNSGQFLLRMTRKVKIKILKQSGVQHANFEIPYYNGNSEWEVVESIEGTTYNLDHGFEQIKLDPKNIFEEKVNDNIRVKKIALSDVRPGSVIELAYTIVTPYFFNMRRWYFQQQIPVLFSNLQYRAIPYYEYTYILRGANELDHFSSDVQSGEVRFGNLAYRETIFNFGMTELPAFTDEEFISSVDDYMVNINFQISKIHYPRGGSQEVMTTWPAMCDDFLKSDYFGKYMNSVEKQARRILGDLDVKGEPDEKKIELITRFVKSKYTWDGVTSKMAESDLKDFLRQQSGSTGNINLLLAGLLKSAGVEAYPVILSTRGNGLISLQHPFQQFFNYVLVMAVTGDRVYLIDGTDPLLHYSVLPEKCMNVHGLVVKPKSEEWITIQQRTTSLLQKNLTVRVDPETSQAEADVMYLATGPAAHRLRSIYSGNPDNLTHYLNEINKINTNEVKTSPNDAPNKPFTFFFTAGKSVDNVSDKLFIAPFCNLNLEKNPFTQSKRTLPVDLVYLREESYKSTIMIPEGYRIEHLPEIQSIENDVISFNYEITCMDNRIIVDAGYSFKQFYILAEAYEQLKGDFNTMIKCFSDMIVLAKE